MNGKIDVLAVMARDAADAYCERNAGDRDWAEELGMDSTKARAAVEGLIEAARKITGIVKEEGVLVSFDSLADLVTALILIDGVSQ